MRKTLGVMPGLILVGALVVMSGCGVWNDPPIVDDGTITISAIEDTSVAISWSLAANEPERGSGFTYEVYLSPHSITGPAQLEDLVPQIEGSRRDFASDPANATLPGLTAGTGYFINIRVTNDRSGEADLYTQTVAITSGVGAETDSYDGSIPYFNRTASGAGATTAIDYSIDIGVSAQDVFIVFTNPAVNAVSAPLVFPGNYEDLDFNGSLLAPSGAVVPVTPPARSTSGLPVVIYDRPGVSNPSPGVLVSRGIVPPPPTFTWLGQSVADDDVDDTLSFYDDSESNTISAICKFDLDDDLTAGANGLSVWVEQSEWIGNGGVVTQTMVNNLAAAFMATSADNDLFDWLTGIYGDEWGDDHSFSNLIPNADHVTILLYDIPSPPGTIVAGYFWAKDNFKSTDIAYSNERVMFYLNSQLLAADFEETVSTIAHEFQHMINFYQRDVRLDLDSETWFNEMMSLVSEDLVSEKMETVLGLDIAGPRGVLPSYGGGSGSAGPTGNTTGRVPTFNGYPQTGLTAWLSNQEVLRSYATAYAFGAYIARNYGGATLFGEMMTTNLAGEEAVMSAAIEMVTGGAEGDLTLADLLWRWGTSVLLSDDTAAPTRYRLNTGGWISDGGYDLGSINHYNYTAEDTSLAGPVIHSSPFASVASVEAAGNVFYQVAEAVSGVYEAVLLMPTGVDYTVVVK